MIRFFFHHTAEPATVTLMLEELGLSYEIVPLETGPDGPRDAAFRAINPNGKAATIEDGGVCLFDASAILLHFAETRAALLGAAEDRPKLLSWLFWLASGLGPVAGMLLHHAVEDDTARRLAAVEAHRHYRVLDEHLAARTFVVGEAFTIADVSAWGFVDRHAQVLGEGGLAGYPNVVRWFDRIDARPAARRARAVGRSLHFASAGQEAAARAMFPQNFAA